MMSNSETEIVRLKTMNLVLMVAVVGSICLSVVAFFRPIAAGKADDPVSQVGNVEAKRFVVRYPDGSLAAEFGIMDEAPSTGLPGLRLYQSGKVRAEVCIQSHDGVRFVLNDATGRERLILFNQSSTDPSKHDSTELSLQGAEGADVIGMQADKHGDGHVSLFDAGGNTRIQLGVWGKDSPPKVVPSIMMFDAKGKEIVTIPSAAQ
jgi:hypothetical protein